MAVKRRQPIKSFPELKVLFGSSASRGLKNNVPPAVLSSRRQSSVEYYSEMDAYDLPVDCDEEKLFRAMVGDVVPLRNHGGKRRNRQKKKNRPPSAQKAATALRALVETGEGFVVSQTPEYMEGRGYGVTPALVRRLHNGDFSVQAHIDLHGHGVEGACQAVDAFLAESIGHRRRVVLIIHGRGLSSAGRPVLKEKLRDWLSSGRWRKWVLAFASARAEDGGAGATYVMLRTRPVTKSQRRGCSFVR